MVIILSGPSGRHACLVCRGLLARVKERNFEAALAAVMQQAVLDTRKRKDEAVARGTEPHLAGPDRGAGAPQPRGNPHHRSPDSCGHATHPRPVTASRRRTPADSSDDDGHLILPVSEAEWTVALVTRQG